MSRSVLLLLIVLLPILTACDDLDTVLSPTRTPVDSPTDAVPTPTREGATPAPNPQPTIFSDPADGFGIPDESTAAFEAELFGAVERTLSGPGYLGCENGQYALRPSDEGLEQVTITLPPDITPGNYDIGTIGSADVSGIVSLADNRVFANRVDGLLILEAMATGGGQAVRGSFDFSASNGAQTINARGEFDFTSDPNAAYCAG